VTLYAAGLPMRAYPTEHGELRRRIARGVHRSYYPAGTARQLLAIIASGDRRPLLGKIASPTLVEAIASHCKQVRVSVQLG
jgi:hypothetical protein